jgi:outer membrane lipoprotein SlyB
MIAAVSVIILSAAAIAAMTSNIASSYSKPAPVIQNTVAPSDHAAAAIRDAEQKVLDPTRAERAPAVTAPAKKASAPVQINSPKKVAVAEPNSAPDVCQICGTVTAVEEVREQGEGMGIGAVGGGVAGAVIGNQIGEGTTRKIATIAGAAAGAYGGHQAEKYIRSTSRFDVNVRMDDGTYATISEKTDPGLKAGDQVKIENGALVRN